MCLEAPSSCKHFTLIIMHYLSFFVLCELPFQACDKIVYFCSISMIIVQINFVIFSYYLFLYLHVPILFILCQLMLSSCTLLQAGIQISAASLPGTGKKWYWYSMSLLIIVTLYIPICSMHESLYVCYIIFCLLTYLDKFFCLNKAF